MNYGDNIKKFRELKSITREKMASDLKLSLSGYSKIERGEIDLTISRIQQIAQILQVDMSQILNFDATQIFNISNNQSVSNVGKSDTTNFISSDHRDKYISLLEAENARLKKELKQNRVK
jgi:transcriptional regulator with XRE-family HTH domain